MYAMKTSWKPGTMVYPIPAVMVSCGATPDEYNIMTAAWDGNDMFRTADVLCFDTPPNAIHTA